MDADKLRSLPIFAGLSDEVVGSWAEKFQATELLAGSILVREGDFAYKFFVVLDGQVEVQRDFQHVATLGPGDFFGEMGLLGRERRNARILALSRCDVAWMMGWDFDALTTEQPAFADRIQAVVDQRMASLPSADN